MGILNQNLVSDVTTDNFYIRKRYGDVYLHFYNGNYINDGYGYAEFFRRFHTQPSGSLTFDSILIGGLGLGTVPQYIALETSCSIIDVIEQDPLLISTISDMGVLDPKISIAEGDIFTYTPTKTYDLITFDIWWDSNGDENTHFHDIIDSLLTQYNPYLNEGGNIYFPIYYPMDVFPSGSTADIYPRPVAPVPDPVE